MSTTNAEPISQPRKECGPGAWTIEGSRVGLVFPPEWIDFLNGLLRDTGDSPEQLFRRALGLDRLAIDTKKEGKAVRAAESADALSDEFEF
ncbi:MAG TPA: hypothetical protein VKP69_03800 [Isosphaeraceae bacterium]|nr:hypothetical protein [Isosphaeraceae bacterium]